MADATPNPIAQTTATNQTKPVASALTTPAATPVAPGSMPVNPATVDYNKQQGVIEASRATPGVVQSTPTGAAPKIQIGTEPEQQTFQAYTNTGTSAQAQADKASIDRQNADAAATKAQNDAALAKATQEIAASGTYYDTATSAWKTGTAPKVTTQLLTPDQKALISSANDSSGILTSDGYNASSAAINSAIATGQANPLPQTNLQDDYASLPPEIQALHQQILGYQQDMADSSQNPEWQQLVAMNALHASEKLANMTSINNKYQDLTDTQTEDNKKAMGALKAAQNAAGTVGSTTAILELNAQMASNDKALQHIARDESSALTEAQNAAAEQDLAASQQWLDYSEKRRTDYNNLLTQQFSMKQEYTNSLQQRQVQQQQIQLNAQQLAANGKTAASDYLNTYAKQNIDPNLIPDSVWQTAVKESGGTISTDTAKALYKGGLVDQQAKTAADFNANTEAFYKAAAALPADSSQVLYRPNPDGTYTSVSRSSVQTNPDYDTFQMTKGGKNFAVYVDKNDPTQRHEVELGTVDPKTTYKDDAFGNTVAITDNGDGTFSSKKVLDFMGNPMGSQAVTNVMGNLSGTGLSYQKSEGALSNSKAEANG